MIVTFAGGASGEWAVERIDAVAGEPLPHVSRLSVGETAPSGSAWILRGATSNERYVEGRERALLAASPPLGRPQATCAALIPVRKSTAWWELAQDERREILEERSHHIATGARLLPAVARRLHHGRDLGEPFDFLTWFEYAPGDAAAFEELVRELRATPEWEYVEREIDIRVRKE